MHRHYRLPILLACVALVSGTPAGAAAPAVVVQINGTPMLTRADARSNLAPGMSLAHGDVIETDDSSKARVVLADDSVLTIGPNSRVVLDEVTLGIDGRKGRLHILAGSFKLAVSKLLSGTTDYVLRTRTAVIGVRGTVVWGDIQLDAVCALDGNVEVRSVKGGRAAQLSTGKCVHEMGLGSPVALEPTASELRKYLEAVTLD